MLFKRKELFTEAETQEVVQAIRTAERLTSGEIRVFVERKCRYVQPLDRALEVFHQLGMHQTHHHNAVLLYVALKDRQLAICGDSGIHEKVSDSYWREQLDSLKKHFSDGRIVEGIAHCVSQIGHVLQTHFPYESDDDNQLPDDIVFGR